MKPDRREHLDENIVVWIAKVSASHESLPFLEPCLDSSDQTRAARFRFPEDRARFVLGRGLLRKCLGFYLNRRPETIDLAYTDRGRPVLPQDETIQFSISHTRDLVALAVTSQARIGIDLEYVQPDLDPLELAGRIFSEEDFRIFQTVPAHEKPAAFFRAWTRKEAYLKARGEGITEGLGQVSVSLGPDEPASIVDARAGSSARNWRLHTLPVSADYMGHLACDNAEKRVEFCPVRFHRGDVVPDFPNGSFQK